MTVWNKKRVVVEISVRDDCISERDLRWAVDTALTTGRTLDRVLRERSSESVYIRNTAVKEYQMMRSNKKDTK